MGYAGDGSYENRSAEWRKWRQHYIKKGLLPGSRKLEKLVCKRMGYR